LVNRAVYARFAQIANADKPGIGFALCREDNGVLQRLQELEDGFLVHLL